MGEATLPLTKSDVTPPSPLPPTPSPSTPTLPPPSMRGPTSGNTLIAIVSYLVSLPLLCYGIWLLLTKDYDCEDALHMPHLRMTIGVGLVVAFTISCFVTHYGAKVVLPGALTLAVALLVMLTFGILLIGSYSMESRAVPASPLWIKSRINQVDIWASVKNCIYSSRTCPDLAYTTIQLSATDLNNKKLSAIEFGCCMPPSICGMEYVNATYWKTPKKEVVPSNSTSYGSTAPPTTNLSLSPSYSANSTIIIPYTYGDCQAWSNELTYLCYDCESCRQGFLSTVHHKWRSHGIFMIAMSAILVCVHTPRFILTMMQRNTS